MLRKPRKFDLGQARRDAVPVSFGIMGPSGSGKTYSALRVATGIVKVTGGKIVLIDTEGKRGLYYADAFDYGRIPLEPPFGALDYLDAIRQAEKAIGEKGCIIVDSMSHEHEGEGGLLWQAEKFLQDKAGDDYRRRDKLKLASFVKPKQDRTELILHLERMTCSIILCFRAKERTRPVMVQRDGKQVMEIRDFGWEPIGANEFAYSMMAMAMLKPNSEGVPTWTAGKPGEELVVKRPKMFRDFLVDDNEPLSEKIGELMAKWASPDLDRASPEQARDPGSPEAASGDDGEADPPWLAKAKAEAAKGHDNFNGYWNKLSASDQDRLRPHTSDIWEIIDAAEGKQQEFSR